MTNISQLDLFFRRRSAVTRDITAQNTSYNYIASVPIEHVVKLDLIN